MLVENPTCWFCSWINHYLWLLIIMRSLYKSVPLIARSNVILRAERDEMLGASWIGAVMFVIRRRDKTCCGKFCSLYAQFTKSTFVIEYLLWSGRNEYNTEESLANIYVLYRYCHGMYICVSIGFCRGYMLK